MANNEDEIKIVFGAEADESSGEQTGKKLRKSVEKGFGDDGRIKVPVDITVPIDSTKKKLTEAQKDITSELSKMMAKGFSASGKDIDTLTSKFDKFTKALDSAGKGRQNKIFREIRKQVEELQKSYKALQDSQKASRPYETKVKKTDSSKKTKSSGRPTTEDEYYKQQEQYSTRAKGAGEKAEAKRELKTYYKEGPYLKSSSNIDQTTFNEHEAKLSKYSSYGSNWARELNKILKKEAAKAIASLVTYIDKKYEIGTDNKLHGKKSGTPTTEAQMISAVYKKVRQDLTNAIKQSEAGDESITVSTLTQLAAIMKVLNKTLMTELSGKSLDQAIVKTGEDIKKAINKPYDIEENDAIGFTDLKEGEQKGVGPGHENTKKIVAEFYDKLKSWDSEIFSSITASTSQLSETLKTVKMSTDYKNELSSLNDSVNNAFNSVQKTTRATESVNRSIKLGNTKEAVEFDQSEKISKENKDVNRDTAKVTKVQAKAGFNIDSKADALIELVSSILQVLQKGISINDESKPSKEKELTKEQEETQDKTLNNKSQKTKDYSIEMEKAWKSLENSIDPIRAQMSLIPMSGTFKNYYEGTDIVKQQRKAREQEEKRRKQEEDERAKVQKSTIYASPLRQGFRAKLEGAFDDLIGATKRYEKVLKANADEQDAMAAERIKTYGLNNGRNPNDTGDIAGMRRILQLYRTNKESIEQNPELAQKIQLTPGRTVDTTELTRALNDALSGKNMRNAQMGGSIPRQILGGMTAFIGMPSLEKSRAQADGLNQILGNINNALQSVLINIQTKETELAGMEASGQAKFTKEGYLTPDSTSAAFKTLADLEEEKLVLDSIKADLLANDKIIDQTGGKFSKLVKNLSFTSPVLKENNGILRNINSGLDKNGKALKFQTRMAEILNYTFQLMSRSIGQMFKNWISMLNPLNIIKRMFEDFASYDPKWQRTMNVIKNNFREIILPFMEKIAQTLVNIIGFLDIISMKIQEAFGYTPISLFDQQNANDFKKTYEEISNITAGFDELHDIGSSGGENDPDNLLGEIYKPQLSQEWIDLANKIGDLFADVIKGDLGFGEAMLRILEILGETLAIIAKKLWDWFKTTDFGKWLIENWKTVLATILALFLAWKLLKIFGPTLLSVIGGAFKSLGSLVWTGIKGIGTKLLDVICGTQFGSDMVRGFKAMFNSGGMIGTFKAGGASLGAIFAQALTAVAGVAIATGSIVTGFDMIADDTSYNMGLMANGGKEEDKKSGAGGAAVSILGGAAGGALAGLAIGGPIGAAIGAGIGAIAGTFSSVLAPAIEEITVKSKEMNNEMQKIEYYEGAVQGASTKVNEFSELLELSKTALETQTNKVYELGENYGISQSRLDQLVQSVKDGTYNTDMLTGSEINLAGSLEQLSWHYTNNADLTDKLTQAKLKLQKAETDLAIAQDIEAGNFEMAAARIEVAYASNVYTAEEATKKMVQIAKEGSAEQASAILKDLSPELQDKFQSEYSTTEAGLNELTDLYFKYSKDEREYFLQNLTGEVQKEMQSRVNAIEQAVKNAPWYMRLLDIGNDGKIFGMSYIDIPGYATGTNYVPSDGLAYLHKGEAVIPAKYNEGVGMQGKAYQAQSALNNQMLNAISRLEQTIAQGIAVKGEFRQRGSDLVATVKKVENRNGNQPLNNPVFAR